MQDVLHQVVNSKWRALTAGAFAKKFVDEVCELEEAVCVATHNVELPTHGLSAVHVLSTGLVVLCSAAERWSLYETRQRVEERELRSAWAGFVRGVWTAACPREPGLYFVRDLELGRRSVRELVRRDGRLVDISGGFVAAGKVTNWCGQWWSEKIPRLPESH